MTIQAWTFLVSRNQSVDYKTIVAPDFISQAKIRSLLIKVTDDDFAQSGQINIRSIQGSEVGDFTVVFRSVKARSKDIGEPGNEVLKDSFGREIDLIEGLVLQSSLNKILGRIRQDYFERVHRELMEKYRQFWYEDRLCDSHEIYLQEDESSPTIYLNELSTFMIARRHQLSYVNQHRATTPRNLAKNKARYTNLIVIIVLAIVVLTILKIAMTPSQATEICNSTITIETMEVNKSREGITYLDELKKKHPNQKEIWINLSSQTPPPSGQSSQTNKSKSQTTPPSEKNNSNLTISLSKGNRITQFEPFDEAKEKLKNKESTNTDISNLTAIIIKSPCFEELLRDR